MQYALLAYAPPEDMDRRTRPIRVALPPGRMLLTDGPFIDSMEYLAGLFLIVVYNLDGEQR
jgi:hypothetical protein